MQRLLSSDGPLGGESAQRSREINSKIQAAGRTKVGRMMISSLTFNILGQGAREDPPNPPPNSEPVLLSHSVRPHPALAPARPSSRRALSYHYPTSPTLEAGNSYPTTHTSLILALVLWLLNLPPYRQPPGLTLVLPPSLTWFWF